MAKSLNKVMLIGNLTRDPELKYTPNGAAVCAFSIATNRDWKTESGEKKEDVEFTNVVAWNKLAEICANLLKKGRKVYVEGRLATHTWQAPDNTQRSKTEVIINDMVILDRKMDEPAGDVEIPETQVEPVAEEKPAKKSKDEPKTEEVNPDSTGVNEEDIPF